MERTPAFGRIYPDRVVAELSSCDSSRRAIRRHALVARASRLLGEEEATSRPSNGGRDEVNIPDPSVPEVTTAPVSSPVAAPVQEPPPVAKSVDTKA